MISLWIMSKCHEFTNINHIDSQLHMPSGSYWLVLNFYHENGFEEVDVIVSGIV